VPHGAHAESLTTTFTGTNGSRGNIFDVVALNDINIISLDANVGSTLSGTIQIAWKVGTGYASRSSGNLGDWTIHETVSVLGAGTGNPTSVPLATPISFTTGQLYSIWMVSSLNIKYSNGTVSGSPNSVGSVYAQDANLQIQEGFGCSGSPGQGPACNFQPRIWNGTLYYDYATDLDGDGYGVGSDCDDADPLVNPGAADLVGDGLDSNCDGLDGVDADGDLYASLASGGDDCDDTSAVAFPGGVEVCDGVDNDCLGGVDELFDVDGDGVTSCGVDGVIGSSDDDCDDNDATLFPGNPELCDGLDNDCNGLSDFDPAGEVDGDGDGSPSCIDCDDTDAANSPLSPELCDGVDNDCNGDADLDVGLESDGDGDGWISCDDCDDSRPGVHPDRSEACDGLDTDCDVTTEYIGGEVDNDGDFAYSCEDCDDDNSSIFPGNPDICDGLDGDCDPATEAAGGESDGDGDGVAACGDCDDSNADIFAGNLELCDGLDNDCDPSTDEDIDGDEDEQTVCEGDCDDGDDRRFTGNPEICDLVDNDCDDSTDESIDGDGDGNTVCDGDCDDDNDAIGPQFTVDEICDDGLDNDCDSFVDLDDNECEEAEDDTTRDDDSNENRRRGGCACDSGAPSGAPPGASIALLLLALVLVPQRRRP
jgi:MYXO-CTERM domain-containing protein